MKDAILLILVAGLAASPVWAESAAPVIDVYKSPSCGCCSKWVDHLQANGFLVRSHNTLDVAQHKIRLGVPYEHASCHTAEVGGYLVEGHVPATDIKRLLKARSEARGLVVPGMPVGSPGMEQGSSTDRYEVLLLKRDGSTQTYSRY